MSVPKKRRSRSKVRRAKTHKKLKLIKLISCSNCNEGKLGHIACKNCGKYKGRQVLNVEKREKRAERKRKSGR